jgi:DNA-binding response OmpR family regulator
MNYLPKILLVDDEEDFLQLMSAMLRNNGFDVYSVSDINEVFTLIKSFKPDIILLDVKLGNQDGREICTQIKGNPETKNIKVLLHSAFSHVSWEYELCGADGFMLKPYDLSDLVTKIKALLQHESS